MWNGQKPDAPVREQVFQFMHHRIAFLRPKNPKPDVDLGVEILHLGQRPFHKRPARLPRGSIKGSRKDNVFHMEQRYFGIPNGAMDFV